VPERNAPEQLTRDGQPLFTRGASFRAATYNPETRTVRVSLGTGAPVLRYDWASDRTYTEVLSMDPTHVRLERMNGGAPFLTDHRQWSTEAVIGRFVAGTVAIVDGELVGDVRLSKAARNADTTGDIVDGILADTSVGYRIYRMEITRDETTNEETRTAVDWEPVEGSVVPVPADTTGGIRSADQTVPPAGDTRATPGATTPKEVQTMDETQMEALRAEGAKAEATRQTGIRALAEKASLTETDVRALLDDSAVTVESAGVRMWDIRAAKDAADPVRSQRIEAGRDAGDAQFRAIAEAVEHQAGVRTLADVVEPGRGLARKSLADLARMNLEAKGIRSAGLGDSEAIRMAIRAVAGHTTGDFSSVFSTVGYKSLMGMYTLANEYNWWKDLGRRSDFSTLNTRTIVKMTGMGGLPTVNEGADYQGVTQYDSAETINPLPKTGGELRLTFEMEGRDDLGAFTRCAAELGKTMQIGEHLKALAAIQANMADGEAVCSAAHANLSTSGGAPDLTKIAELDAKLRAATDGHLVTPHVIGTAGKVLLIPVAQRTTVEQLYSDRLYAADPADCPTVPLSAENRRAVPGLTTKYFLCTANPLGMEYGWYQGGPTVTQYAEEKSDSLIWHARNVFGIGVIRHQDFASNPGQ
jgi:hypothetical protein